MSTFPGANPVRGLWQIVRAEGDVAFLNTVPLERAVLLVPDRTNHWDILVEATGEHLQGTFPASQVLDELDADGILALGGRLGAMVASGASYLEWLSESPLIPQISKRAQCMPFEAFVEKHLGALEDVCQKPRGHLHREIERVPVARARRIPAHAITYLAAHTEDWERPTLSSVRPKRVLALVQDDQWDIYENRVAVRLVDHLRSYLDRRLHELGRLADILDKVGDHSAALSGATYWRRRERISRLWGDAEDAKNGSFLVKDTLKRIGRLRRRVAALMDSWLYQEIPRNATVETVLRQTNVLSSDGRYRRMALLWGEWARQMQSHHETPAEIQDKQQRMGLGFDHFCQLLVVRAFDQLGYEPRNLDSVPARHSRHTFDGRYGPVDVEWSEDGTIELRGRQTLRIVPVFASLASSIDERELQDQISEMERATVNLGHVLVLYPSAAQNKTTSIAVETRKRIWGLGHEQRRADARRLGFLPVSPWDIASVERVARALRWVILGAWLMEYPRVVGRPPNDLDASLINGWIDTTDRNAVRLLRKPSSLQWQRIEAERCIRRETVEKIQAQLDALPARELDDRRKLSERNRQKSQLDHDLKQAKVPADEMDLFCRQIENAGEFIDTLLKCPVCSKQTHEMHALARGTFQNACSSCESTWGKLVCSHCSKKFPFLRIKAPERPMNHADVGMVDEWLGSDVLAVPCVHDVFLCPECGTRPCKQCQ